MWGIAVLARIQMEANRRWRETFDQITLEEKRGELQIEPGEMAFFAAGINATMLSANIALVINWFQPHHGLAFLLMGLSIFMAGIGPVLGLHCGDRARLARQYSVRRFTIETIVLDSLYANMVLLALGAYWNNGENLAVDLLLLALGLVAQVILVRWSFFNKSPIRSITTKQ